MAQTLNEMIREDDAKRKVTFLHMHHAMATKALMQAKYTEGLADKPASCAERIRELIMSGAVDYKDRFQPVEVTSYDRIMALRYLTRNVD